MAAAASSFVPLVELQAWAGAAIAEATGAEAGCVASGAAACLFLAAAAAIAGSDPAAMDRLPDTTGLRNEIAVHRAHRNPYDHALRAAGARLVEFGYLGPANPGTRPWQLEAVISERTAAVAYPAAPTAGVLSLREVAEIAHRHGLPVIVDAAETLPPVENLRRFIAEGADLVTYSGGKSIGAPAASGMLAGRRDLILSATAQQQDMYVRPESWPGPQGGTTATAIPSPPQQGIGRIVKVGREEVVGLVVALRRYLARDHRADHVRWRSMATTIADRLNGRSGVQVVVEEPAVTVPQAVLRFPGPPTDASAAAAAIARGLRADDPRIFVGEDRVDDGELVIYVTHLTDAEVEMLVARLLGLLAG